MSEQLARQQDQEELDASMTSLGSILVVSLQAVLYPELVDRLRMHMLERVRATSADAIALSFEGVTSLDAPTIEALRRVLLAAKLLGTTVYIAKLKPVIAATIVNLKERLPGVVEVQNLQDALLAQQRRRGV